MGGSHPQLERRARRWDTILGVNYPPARHRDGTHKPVEYALHSWFIPSDVSMPTHDTSQTTFRGAGKVNVATCFMIRAMVGKPRTNCPSGEDTFVSVPISEIMV